MSDVILRHVPIRWMINYFSDCLFLTIDKRERIKMTSLGRMPSFYRARGHKGIPACIIGESQLKLGLLVHSLCCYHPFLICIAGTAVRLHTMELCAADLHVFCTEALVPDTNLAVKSYLSLYKGSPEKKCTSLTRDKSCYSWNSLPLMVSFWRIIDL